MKTTLAFFENLTIGKKLLLILAPILTVLISMKAALLGLFILILVDLLTGIRKSIHERNIKIGLFSKPMYMVVESYLLRRTWKKAYEYGIGILVIATLRALVFGGQETLINIGLTNKFSLIELSVIIPAIIEIWSIFENIEAVSGNNPLKKLFKLFPSFFKTLLGEDKDKK